MDAGVVWFSLGGRDAGGCEGAAAVGGEGDLGDPRGRLDMGNVTGREWKKAAARTYLVWGCGSLVWRTYDLGETSTMHTSSIYL